MGAARPQPGRTRNEEFDLVDDAPVLDTEGLYLQIKAGPQSKGTVILYTAEIIWR
jgi:hypothetical protein